MNSYLVVYERAEDGGWGAYLDWLKERGETAPAPSSCEVGFIAA